MEASLKNPDFKMFKRSDTQAAHSECQANSFTAANGTIEKGIPAKEQSDPRGLKQKPS